MPTERVIEPESIATLRRTAERLLGEGLEVQREGVCWRPVTRRGTPIVGELEGEQGVFVAAGHGAWGISLSLGTGFVMAGMVKGKRGKVELGADVGGLGL